MPNRYNDQDYPRYSDRDDRYDSYSSRESRSRGEQRRRSGSGRENTQGGSSDYNQGEQTGYYGMSYNRDFGRNFGHGSTGFQGGYFNQDFGRGYNSEDRDYDDFASSARPGSNYTGGFGRNTGSDRGDYTLYGYDRESQYSTREGDYGGYGERREDYQNQNYGSSGGSGNYGRSYDRQQQDREHGGSSRYYGNQSGSSSYNQNTGQGFYGQGGDYTGSFDRYSGYTGDSEEGYNYRRGENRFRDNRSEQDERNWWDRTSDEVASWFGDEEAARRRERDARQSNYGNYGYGQENRQTSHRGKGPKNYRRSDERIKEDINERLTDYAYLDASDIDVEVSGGEVTLTGTVESRYAKRMAEDIAENVSGVTHVENRLRVNQQNQGQNRQSSQTNFASTNTAGSSGTYGSPEDLAANYSNQNLSGASPLNKPATGNLTGSSDVSDTSNTTGGANAGTSSSTTGSATGSNPGTMTASASGGTSATSSTTSDTGTSGSDKSDTSSAFSERGVDKLSKPSK